MRFGKAKTEAQAGPDPALENLAERLGALENAVTGLAQTLSAMHANQSVALIDSLAATPRFADARRISCAHGQVFSQNNEDGIIAEIFRRIGTRTRRFVEVAAGDGIENTTRLLLETGWQGLWVEAGDAETHSIRHAVAPALESGALRLVAALITMENIETELLSVIDFEPDYVSVDIDYNTAHVWRKLLPLRPRLFCIEYNAHYPPGMEFEVPYRADGVWRGTTRFGASLKALEKIGREGGYSLVGCDIFGVNAFFVRDDLVENQLFLAPFSAENHYEPPRYSAVRMRGHGRHPEI
ncbi:MAG: hypothetical protein KIS86_08935 [Devosia sp.]|nr:hypothetical protein [Devosia sp.]